MCLVSCCGDVGTNLTDSDIHDGSTTIITLILFDLLLRVAVIRFAFLEFLSFAVVGSSCETAINQVM